MQIEIDARSLDVLAEPTVLVGLFERRFETRHGLGQELSSNVVVTHRRAHGVTGNRHALNQRVRVVTQYLSVVTRARLTLVGVTNEILLDTVVFGHEAPLQPGRETGAAASAQPGGFDLLDDCIAVELAVEHLFPGFVAADLLIVAQRPAAIPDV